MYQELLKSQWKTLCGDFSAEFDYLTSKGEFNKDIPNVYNEWFQTRIHRWSSVVYTEGVTLNQLNNPGFAGKLRSTMQQFSFTLVSREKEKQQWPGAVIGIALGVVIFFLIKHLFSRSVILSVIAGILSGFGISYRYFASVDSANRNEANRVKNAYVSQVQEWEANLLDICQEYGID